MIIEGECSERDLHTLSLDTQGRFYVNMKRILKKNIYQILNINLSLISTCSIGVVAIKKGAFWSPPTMVAKFTYL